MELENKPEMTFCLFTTEEHGGSQNMYRIGSYFKTYFLDRINWIFKISLSFFRKLRKKKILTIMLILSKLFL